MPGSLNRSQNATPVWLADDDLTPLGTSANPLRNVNTAAANAVSTSLSGTIPLTGNTVTVAFINTARQEVINPSAATLWASWGTPAVNGAGSFPIAAGGAFSTDRTAGTLRLLSTVDTQPYTVNRYS